MVLGELLVMSFFFLILVTCIFQYHFFLSLLILELTILFSIYCLIFVGSSSWHFCIFVLVFSVVESCFGLSLMVFLSRIRSNSLELVLGGGLVFSLLEHFFLMSEVD